ncbi:MAG: hypothetical protein Q7T74_02225 [Candidatus Saccharibacteria bacterium]|nr:hypothetical protein [Candidatus Saccharibacteria bacterium]
MNSYVVKSGGLHESEIFDPLKLHGSLMAACLAVRSLEGEAHMVAQKITEKVIDWLDTKTEVTSDDVRRVAANGLQVYQPEAAYIYETYKDIL